MSVEGVMAELSMTDLVNKTKAKMDNVVRSFVIELGTNLVMASPVGDASYWKLPAPIGYTGGRFRGNWQYGFNAAPSGDLDVIDKSGEVSTKRITDGASRKVVAGVHYVVNNLPYAQAIENGHSRQAPTGVVSLTEVIAQQILRELVKNANEL